MQLPATVTFDYPSPAALAKFLAEQAVFDAAPPSGSDGAPFDAALPQPAVLDAHNAHDVVTEMAAIAASVLGSVVETNAPLMAAGLDSLGATSCPPSKTCGK